MQYRIAIVGPTRRQGESTLSTLLALTLPRIFTTRVCLTYTGTDSTSYNTFLGVGDNQDPTRSLSQLVRLLDAGTVADTEIEDYLTDITHNVNLLQTAELGMHETISSKLLIKSLEYLHHDFIITDVNTELSEEITQVILKKADLVVVTLSQGTDVINKLKLWQAHPLFPEQHKVVYIVNFYDDKICALREISKHIGVRHVRVAKLNYNPFIRKMANLGKLQDIVPYIFNKDSRVVDLLVDLQEIMTMIGNNIGMAIQWPGDSQ